MKLVSTYESEFVQTLCFCFLMLYSSGLYSIGFFPPKPPNYIRSEWHHLSTVTEKSTAREEFSNQPKYRKLVSKLVLMVVDGMRNDMAQNLSTFKMVKQKNIASAGIMKFVAKAETPTVTMPRIKAIVTGKISLRPLFLDEYSTVRPFHEVGRNYGVDSIFFPADFDYTSKTARRGLDEVLYFQS